MATPVDFRLEMLVECSSTQELVLARRGQPSFHGTALLALRQTAGYGRRGRDWFTGEGNLALSVGLELPGSAADRIPLLPFVAGLALHRVVRAHLPDGADLRLKWPNDLYLDGKKLSGLIAQARQSHDLIEVVLGVGVNLRESPPAMGEEAVALAAYGRPPAPRPFAEAFLRELTAGLAQWEDFPSLRGAWERAARLGEGPMFVVGEKAEVWPLELLPTGELLVQGADGENRRLASETVSLRFQPAE